MKIYLKLFGFFEVILLTQFSCSSKNYHQPKGQIEKLTPSKYQKTPLTRQSVEITKKTYSFKYKFSSPSNEWFEWSWKYKRLETIEMINKFGISKSIFEPFQATEKNVKSRNRIIKTSLFKKEGNVISPDFNRMIPFYMGFTSPLYALTIRTLGKDSTPRERVEFLLRFVQDIPYGIPPTRSNSKVISGVLSPPQIFIEKWGDCDSKVLLLSSILAHEPRYKILLLHLDKHLLMAFEGRPHPNDAYIIFQGKNFILADPTGPARLPLGNPGPDFKGQFKKIEALLVTSADRKIPHYVSRVIEVKKVNL
jgi:hypothetical protein